MAGKASRENGKKGGRPPGTKNPETLMRERVMKEFRKKALEAASVLFSSQLHNAVGHTYLYKIEKELQIGPKGGKKYVASKPKLVTAQSEIESFLLDKIIQGDVEDENDPNATYYFLTTEKPETKAIDSILDRAWGKATQIVATEDDEGNRHAIEGNAITFADFNEADRK